MKTLLLCMLLFVNNGFVNSKLNFAFRKDSSPVSTLKVDLSQSMVSWHITKLTGAHTGTLKMYWGQLTVQNRKLTGGSILIDTNTLDVTDLTSPDKQKLEANLKGDNFFETGRFTVARFDITDVKYSTGGDTSQVSIFGNLTMHGITKKIDFNAFILKNNGAELIVRADLNINRRDWNIATANFKYDHFISPVAALHIIVRALSNSI